MMSSNKQRNDEAVVAAATAAINLTADGGVEFAFPYAQPYDIQTSFMRALYRTLEAKKIGIFESPTGTVKIIDHRP